MAYPVGEEAGGSTGTLVAAILGAVLLWRSNQWAILRLLVLPFAMGLAVAIAGKYPYGGPARFTQYLVPSICLLTGLGGAALIARVSARRWGRRSLGVAIVLLAALGVGLIARDVARPYRVPGDAATQRFARWFWTEHGRDARMVCVKADLGFSFRTSLWQIGMSAVYLCNHHMFAPPHGEKTLANRAALEAAATQKTRLVFFGDLPVGDPLFESWVARLRRWYSIGPARAFVIAPGKADEMWLRDRYVELELTPRRGEDEVAQGGPASD
jgi:hypothetical protein